jgi:hypothetical protein
LLRIWQADNQCSKSISSSKYAFVYLSHTQLLKQLTVPAITILKMLKCLCSFSHSITCAAIASDSGYDMYVLVYPSHKLIAYAAITAIAIRYLPRSCTVRRLHALCLSLPPWSRGMQGSLSNSRSPLNFFTAVDILQHNLVLGWDFPSVRWRIHTNILDSYSKKKSHSSLEKPVCLDAT